MEKSKQQENEHEEILVKDRRRINLDNLDSSESSIEEETNLAPTYVEQLEARARAAEQKLLDIQTRFDQASKNLQRETDEIRQRLNRAADERAINTKIEFVKALLPSLDNLRRAIEAADSGSSKEALLDGLRGTANGFESSLATIGVEAIQSVGTVFNPELHEAVDMVEVEDPEQDGIITAEYSKGYKLGERLLRPARVQVGRAKAEAQSAKE